MQRVVQIVDDLGALDHVAHEQEQRDGDKSVVLHYRIGVLVQQIENLVVEHIGDRLDAARLVIGVVAKANAHSEQREGDRKSEQYNHDKNG